MPPVEAFIALSIVFVALEVVRKLHGHVSLASRKPWLVAFTFGLLHGLGFASALSQIGLPRDNVPIALLFFNVVVELGQIEFIAFLLAVSALDRRFSKTGKPGYGDPSEMIHSGEIGRRSQQRPTYSIPSALLSQAVSAHAECLAACRLNCVPVVAEEGEADATSDARLQLAI